MLDQNPFPQTSNNFSSGEYVQAQTLSEYWEKLKKIYQTKSDAFQEITQKEYEALEKSEREDSDNHYNEERLGKDTQVVDITFYKYLPDRQTYYRIHLVDIHGQQDDHFLRLVLKSDMP